MINKLQTLKSKQFFKPVKEILNINTKIHLFMNCQNKLRNSGKIIIFGKGKVKSELWKNLQLNSMKRNRNL